MLAAWSGCSITPNGSMPSSLRAVRSTTLHPKCSAIPAYSPCGSIMHSITRWFSPYLSLTIRKKLSTYVFTMVDLPEPDSPMTAKL